MLIRAVIKHIQSTTVLSSISDAPTTIHVDNATCIDQMKKWYIKGDNTKHIAPKLFLSRQQQERQKIEVKQTRFQVNLADLFTKLQPKPTFQKHV